MQHQVGKVTKQDRVLMSVALFTEKLLAVVCPGLLHDWGKGIDNKEHNLLSGEPDIPTTVGQCICYQTKFFFPLLILGF